MPSQKVPPRSTSSAYECAGFRPGVGRPRDLCRGATSSRSENCLSARGRIGRSVLREHDSRALAECVKMARGFRQRLRDRNLLRITLDLRALRGDGRRFLSSGMLTPFGTCREPQSTCGHIEERNLKQGSEGVRTRSQMVLNPYGQHRPALAGFLRYWRRMHHRYQRRTLRESKLASRGPMVWHWV